VTLGVCIANGVAMPIEGPAVGRRHDLEDFGSEFFLIICSDLDIFTVVDVFAQIGASNVSLQKRLLFVQFRISFDI